MRERSLSGPQADGWINKCMGRPAV